jgi:glutathionylspermidine synthase
VDLEVIEVVVHQDNIMISNRHDFFEKYFDVFGWYDIDEYACFDVLTVSKSTVEKIQNIAANVWSVLLKASDVMREQDNKSLIEFGYPPETFRLLRQSEQLPFIARCDFAVTNKGIFLLECNAEVCTFIVETFRMNGLVAKHFRRQDPNLSAEKILKKELNKYINLTANYLNKPVENCRVVFAAMGESIEDMGTAKYLCSLCNYNSSFCPIENIEMDSNWVYGKDGEIIDIIYRIYPTEWMVDDLDPKSDAKLWDFLEPLIFDKKVALINPVNTLITQNKALMALITKLGAPFFGQDSKTVKENFLSTFLDRDKINIPFVSKPIFGREGVEIKIITDEAETAYNLSSDYEHFPIVYQEYVEMPEIVFQGKISTLQFSCFLINGIAVGIAARIGNKIIDNTSKFLPIGYLESSV